jgi:hypothetical protein
MMPFEPGYRGGGRPKGAKSALATHVLRDLLGVWNEPILSRDGKGETTRGIAALRIMSKERPADFCKLYGSLMPKELWLDNTLSELGNEEIDSLIEAMRERVRALREQKAIAIDVTPIKALPAAGGA